MVSASGLAGELEWAGAVNISIKTSCSRRPRTRGEPRSSPGSYALHAEKICEYFTHQQSSYLTQKLPKMIEVGQKHLERNYLGVKHDLVSPLRRRRDYFPTPSPAQMPATT